MKRLFSFFLLSLPLFSIGQNSGTSSAPTADQIVENYIKAVGGLEGFQAVKTARMTGTVTAQGMDLPLTIQMINNRAVRTDVEVMGQTITSSYIDGKGWKLNPLQGVNEPTDVDGVELTELKIQSHLANSLMDYKSQGNKIELEGEESVEGVKTYKIKMTAGADQRVTTYYISSTDFLLLKTVASREIMGTTVEVETLFSDIKEYNGLKFPGTRTQSANGTVFQVITLSNIELNTAVDEKVFSK